MVFCFITANALMSIVAPWLLNIDRQSLWKKLKVFPLYLLGIGPMLTIPNVCKHWKKRKGKYYYFYFILVKGIGGAFESIPALLLTSYATVTSLCTSNKVPPVSFLTWISLCSSIVSLSLCASSWQEFGRDISKLKKFFLVVTNCCQIYVSAITPALMVASLNVLGSDCLRQGGWVPLTYSAFFGKEFVLHFFDLRLQGSCTLSCRLVLLQIDCGICC